ncbi:hypothetical protein GW17_00022836 [Ensete ventricosum]|nr:hypothetical protein GW17_00022836 [Ensete ventricosum]
MISVGFNAAARSVITLSLSLCYQNGFVIALRPLKLVSTSHSVRISNELGAGNPKAAKFSVVVVTAVSSAVSVVAATIILCLRDYISYIFTDGETVARAVSDLCPLLAGAVVLNGIQPVLSEDECSHVITVCNLAEKVVMFSVLQVEEAKKRLAKWEDKEEPLLS